MKFRLLQRLDTQKPVKPTAAPGWSDLPTDDEVIGQIRSVPEHFADLTITAASVLLVSGNKTAGLAGAAIAIGQSLYFDTADSRWKLADANASGKDVCTGISLSQAAAAEQPLTVLADNGGSAVLGFGAILTAGETYIVSATAGGIAPITDAATGWKVCILGIALTTANLKLIFFAGGTAHA